MAWDKEQYLYRLCGAFNYSKKALATENVQ